jgi:hypothetical protein
VQHYCTEIGIGTCPPGGTVFAVKVMAENRDYDLLSANGVCPQTGSVRIGEFYCNIIMYKYFQLNRTIIKCANHKKELSILNSVLKRQNVWSLEKTNLMLILIGNWEVR